ncbi:MAG: hypothetical protein Q9212_002477 [Teloschistes hypoglaucus]
MEPLSRALHLARDRLSEMRGDVSFIDDVLHLAANLRMDSMMPRDHEVVSTHNGKSTSLADAGTTAGSLLARGTAVDLEIVQNNVTHLDNQHTVSLGQTLDSANERTTKRRRLGEIDSLEAQDGSQGQSLQQRLASRDAMPPPPGRLLNTTVRDPNPCFPFGLANGQKRTSTPAVSGLLRYSREYGIRKEQLLLETARKRWRTRPGYFSSIAQGIFISHFPPETLDLTTADSIKHESSHFT